jgi:sulfite reductase (NADPH) hemoprotein beta-component
MYAYDELDRTIINERVDEFRDQVKRRLSGELTEDEFKMLRLQNGVYLQLHAYMLRVAIPYGTLSSKQLRRLAHVARRYDRGYGHFTTRQNIQYNWIKLAELPDALADLAEVGIHAQRDFRSMGRSGARRNRGSPNLVRAVAAIHHATSGILVPAAQVQICDHRVRS